jgi:hypothetical protein
MTRNVRLLTTYHFTLMQKIKEAGGKKRKSWGRDDNEEDVDKILGSKNGKNKPKKP